MRKYTHILLLLNKYKTNNQKMDEILKQVLKDDVKVDKILALLEVEKKDDKNEDKTAKPDQAISVVADILKHLKEHAGKLDKVLSILEGPKKTRKPKKDDEDEVVLPVKEELKKQEKVEKAEPKEKKPKKAKTDE